MPADGETMIERVIRVLEAFEDEHPLSASGIARRTGISVRSAHRIVTGLVRSSLLVRDGRNGIAHWRCRRRSPVSGAIP